MKYPFTPKSTAYLEPGQYWLFDLSNGLKACGVVLQLQIKEGKRDTRTFLAGLLDWTGSEEPTAKALEQHALIAHGQVHIKTILENGSAISGKYSLENSNLSIPLTLDEAPGPNCRLRKGFEMMGKATTEQQRSLETFKTWGYRVIKVRAEMLLVKSAS